MVHRSPAWPARVSSPGLLEEKLRKDFTIFLRSISNLIWFCQTDKGGEIQGKLRWGQGRKGGREEGEKERERCFYWYFVLILIGI